MMENVVITFVTSVFARPIRRIRRWGKTEGWKEKGGWGVGEERAAGGGRKGRKEGRELGKREKRRELIN